MMRMNTTKVDGEKRDHRVFLYALSTCGWCKKTKQFMLDQGVAYEYIDVDEASSEDKREIVGFLRERNIRLGFPITVVDDEVFIIGYKPDEFKEALGL